MPFPSLSTTETLLSCTMCSPGPSRTSHRIWRHQHLKPIRVCSCHFEVKLSLFFHFPPLTSFLQRGPAPLPLLRVELGTAGARALSLCPAPSRCNRSVSQQRSLVFRSVPTHSPKAPFRKWVQCVLFQSEHVT